MSLSLIIDKEFKNLTTEFSESEYSKLEENLFDNGCLDRIHVWNGIILDGHKRYQICKKWDIPFLIKHHDFSHRCEAIIWICIQNITPNSQATEELRKYQIGKRYEASKELFLLSYTEKRTPRFHYKIATDLSLEYNVVPNTIYKYGIYARCIDNIYQKEPGIVAKILAGKLKISHDNIVELSRMPKESIRRLNSRLSDSSISHIGYSDMRHELQWKSLPTYAATSSRIPRENPDANIAIKQMPEYDPDAEISSLALTIPSWISSIQRTQSMANLPLISAVARNKIKAQLQNLSMTVDEMLTAIEEEL